jgi:hypothetical protein
MSFVMWCALSVAERAVLDALTTSQQTSNKERAKNEQRTNKKPPHSAVFCWLPR